MPSNDRLESPSVPAATGLERLGFLLAGAAAVVAIVATLMVRDHVEARANGGPDQLATSTYAPTN